MGNATGLEAPNLLTVREIRDIFGVSRSTVYRWIDQEKFSKVGKVNGLEDYQRQKVLLLEPLDPGLIEEIQAWMKKRSKSKKPLFLAQKLARSAIGQIPIEPIDQDHHDEKKLSKEIQALLAELSEEREARNRFLQELELAAQDLKQGANISEEAQLTKILTSLDKIRQSELELLRETETLVPNQAGFSPPSQLTEKGTKAFQEDREEPLPSEPGPGEEAGVQEAEEEGTPREAPKGQRDGENPDDLGERSSSEGGEAPGELEVLEEQDLSRDQELPQEETSGEESPRKGQREECILEKAEGDEDLLTIEMSADDLPAWLDSPEPPQNPDHGITQEEEEDLEDSFLGEEEPPNTFTPEEEEAADPKDFDEPAPALESEEIQEDLAASFLGEEPGAEPHVKAQEKAQEETNRAEESARSLAMLFGVSLEDPATEAPGNEEEAVEVQEDEVGGSQDPDTQDLTTPDLKDQEEAPQEPEQQENSLASLFGLNPETGRPLQEKQSGETIPQKAPSSQGQEPEEGQGKGIAMVFDTTPSAEEESEASTESANEIAMVFDASEEPDQKEEPKEKKEEEQSQDSIAMVFGAPGQEQEKKEEQKNAQAEEQSQDSIAMVFGAPGQEQEKKEEQKDAQ
ncbi:MAG TPA: helix-turn-helix domain-containing protein, partial [Planctomycetes bacterium]|nr:helix-turn-helix domain-containing protein [Planctomycetota bacterium]